MPDPASVERRYQAGDRLGLYTIRGEIGAGGMGRVYRAFDSRLGREVAIKVAAERFSERFERETRAVAALNHPNICTVYDVGANFLVMELVDGGTLRHLLGTRSRSTVASRSRGRSSKRWPSRTGPASCTAI